MKTRIIVLIGVLLIALPLTGSAQTRNILKKKKENTVNEKIGKGVNRLSNRLLNSLNKESSDSLENADSNSDDVNTDKSLENNSDKGQNNQSNIMMNLLSKGGSNIKHEDKYTFDNSLKMLMEGNDIEDQGKVYFTSYYNSKTNDIAVSMESTNQSDNGQVTGQIITIMDSKNKCGVMLTGQGDQKMALITNMDEEVYVEGNEEYEDDISTESEHSYNKTGRTKNILGYKCFEYKYTNSGGEAEYWLTEELDFKMDRQAIEKSGMPMFYDDGQFEGMVMMEMLSYDEEGQSMHILVTEVNTNSNQTFSLAGYNVMSIDTSIEN